MNSKSQKNQGTKIVIGTSGYSYEDWRGFFYPENISKEDFLDFYSHEFNGVELNFTYYSFPNPLTIARIAEKTTSDFSFALKANQLFTHSRDKEALHSIPSFLIGIAPLIESDKIKALLFQFPYSFHYQPKNRIYLKNLIEEFKEKGEEDFPIAVEFRNTDWFKESVIENLKEMKVTLVNVDLPQIPNLPIPGNILTSDIAYIRFHGRNQKNWWKGDNVSRYDYLYSKKELEEWLPLIDKVFNHVKILLLFFNNHHKAKAVFNARMMKDMLLCNIT